MRFSIIKSIAVAGLLVAASGRAARAATETFNHTDAVSSSPGTNNYTITPFNPALGTLTGVAISDEVTMSSIVEVGNGSSSTEPYSLVESQLITLNGPDSLSAGSTVSNFPVTGSLAALSSTQTSTYGTGLLSITVPVADFAAFESPVTESYSFVASTPNYTYGNGIFGSPSFEQANDDNTVTYTYTYTAAVPEPGSLSLIGVGSLALLRRRSRRVR